MKKLQISIFFLKKYLIDFGKNPPICVNIIMFQLNYMLFSI